MRIWMLTSEMPHEIAGGIARYVENFARLLGAAGHEVVIIARTEQECDMLLAPGVRLIGVVPRFERRHEPSPHAQADAHPAYPYNVMSYWPAFSYQLAADVIRLLQHLPSPDVIESQEYSAIPYYLLQRKLTEKTELERIPILVHLHSPTFEIAEPNHEPRYRLPDYWVGQMEKFAIVAADGILSPSQFLARRVQARFSQPLGITTIPYPCPKTNVPLAPTVSREEIVYVGRLELRKGVLPLVKACSQMWAAGAQFRLSLIGGDVDFLPRNTTVGEFLRQRYQRWLDSGHLKILGQLPHPEVLRHMRQAWATVVPSTWENFPHTCIEAMSEGQVVLASRAGGQAEMIEQDGVNGFLFDWQTAGEFERQLSRILSLSESERLRIARCAQERMQTLCAPEVVLPRRLDHYQSLLSQHQPRRSFPCVHTITIEGPGASSSPLQPIAFSSQEQRGLLSIVVPFYNLGAYLPETLKSISATAPSPYEVIIINDGSTEAASLAVLEGIEQSGRPHVRIIHTENRGLATARNTGAEQAQGEFLSFVDADDLVEDGFFAQALALLQRYENVTFVYSWVRYFGEAQEIWPTWNAEFPYLLGHNMLVPLTVMRRSAFLAAARNKPEFAYNFEDYESWLSLLEHGGVGVSLPQPLVQYRVRSGSMYQSSNRNQQLYLYDLLTQHHAKLYRRWGVELFNLQNANGPGAVWHHPGQEVAGPSQAYVTALVQERDRLVAEVKTLGKAWEDHVRFIADQRAYIESLEARCRELILMNENGSALMSAGNGVTAREYEVGGQVVNRLRKTWIARQIFRSPKLKKVIRKTLGM